MHDKPTRLYRHFDAQDRLLYVGISLNQQLRLEQHMRGSKWAADIVKVLVELYPNRAEAKQAETAAIQTENPVWNIAETLWTDYVPRADTIRVNKVRSPRVWKPTDSALENMLIAIDAATAALTVMCERGAKRRDDPIEPVIVRADPVDAADDRRLWDALIVHTPKGALRILTTQRRVDAHEDHFFRADKVRRFVFSSDAYPPAWLILFEQALARYDAALLAIPEQETQSSEASAITSLAD